MDEEDELGRWKKKKTVASTLLLAAVTLSVGFHELDNPFHCERLRWVEHVSRMNLEGPNTFFTSTECTTHPSWNFVI